MRGQISMTELLGDPQRSIEDEGLAEDLRIACYQNREQLLEALRYPYDMDRIVDTLKKVHGTGGRSLTYGFANYDATKLWIQINRKPTEDGKTIRIPWTEKRYTWRQVANEMIRLYEEELYGDYQRE